MGKKRNRSKKISKGTIKNISNWVLKAIAREVTDIDKELNLIKAWRAGKNPWVTIPNPDGSQTNKRFIRRKANDVWGSHKRVYDVKKELLAA